MDVYVSTRYESRQLKWTFGTCTNSSSYDDYNKYFERCCLPPGQHILTCENTEKPDGWKNAYIEINGRRFCDDFMSYTLMEKVAGNGNYIQYIHYTLLRQIRSILYFKTCHMCHFSYR